MPQLERCSPSRSSCSRVVIQGAGAVARAIPERVRFPTGWWSVPAPCFGLLERFLPAKVVLGVVGAVIDHPPLSFAIRWWWSMT